MASTREERAAKRRLAQLQREKALARYTPEFIANERRRLERAGFVFAGDTGLTVVDWNPPGVGDG